MSRATRLCEPSEAEMEATCWVLPHESADGPANMAMDEALLDMVAADPSAAWLRTYGWTVPTLSLGYFQRWADAQSDPRWRDVPIVRRPTGGGAIWHDRELTYALVVPENHPLSRPSRALYRAVHGAIAGLLRSQGLAADRRGSSVKTESAPRTFLCFTDGDSEDIVSDGNKVVGSAQRRRSGAVLQHGSVLLARSAATPELPGAGDLAPLPTEETFWARLIRDQIPAALGLRSRLREFPDPVRQRSRTLEDSVYRDSHWTRAR
jgi:lipoate-protein ligase A